MSLQKEKKNQKKACIAAFSVQFETKVQGSKLKTIDDDQTSKIALALQVRRLGLGISLETEKKKTCKNTI